MFCLQKIKQPILGQKFRFVRVEIILRMCSSNIRHFLSIYFAQRYRCYEVRLYKVKLAMIAGLIAMLTVKSVTQFLGLKWGPPAGQRSSHPLPPASNSGSRFFRSCSGHRAC